MYVFTFTWFCISVTDKTKNVMEKSSDLVTDTENAFIFGCVEDSRIHEKSVNTIKTKRTPISC